MWIDILIAFGIVGGVGLILGILLALVSHFFAVAEDERTKKIRQALPGANCGACGFKGCDDYASAVAEGKAKPNLCIPGGENTATQLSEILGTEVSSAEKKTAFVHCNGNCKATSKKFEYDGIKSCRAASAIYGGPNACSYGCLGFGDCANVCPTNAICVNDGIAHIDPVTCIGCGACVSACPKHVISLIPTSAKTVIMCNSNDKGAQARKNCSNACIGCKKCEKSCPENAISVSNNLASIDYSRCTGCGACVDGCPTGCIKSLIVNEK